MSRQKTVELLKEYFTSKGKALTAEEYMAAEDAPIRYQVVKRKLGPWNRILNMIGEIPALEEPAKEPVKAPVKTPPKATK